MDNNNETKDVDVLVIGGGGSGMTAALRAKENGVERVLLIEKNKNLGGTSMFPAGFLAVESPVQKRMGIKDTIDEVWLDHMNKADWDCDGKLCRSWFKESGNLVRWLEEKGMIFDEVVEFSGVRRLYHRMLGEDKLATRETGYYLVECLKKALRDENVEILCSTTAEKLITNNAGDVVGAIADSADNTIKINARKVIVSTGSISGNLDLVKRLYKGEDLTGLKTQANMPFNRGEGHLMIEEIGGLPGRIIPLFLGPNNHPNNLHVGLIVRRPQVMTVNREGERYTDEAIHATHKFGCIAGVTLQRQPGRVCYPIIDQALLDDMVTNRKNVSGLEDIQGRLKSHDVLNLNEADAAEGKAIGDGKGVLTGKTDWLGYLVEGIHSEAKAGRVIITDSLDEIADFIGCDHDVLKQEIARYNDYCRVGYDDDFLKDNQWLFPVSTPPFYCFKAKQGVDTFMGGISINHYQEVLGLSESPIKNLYASGIGTSGFLGHGYAFCGTEFGYSLYSGWAAGTNAAKALKKAK